MKYPKLLGLSAGVGVALMAFVGVTSASASILCKTNTGAPTGTTCAEGWIYQLPQA